MSDSANQIFISYRREDSADITGRIYDHLVRKFGKEAVFKDVDSIGVGRDYRRELDATISRCAVTLVVIGAKWLQRRGRNGKPRLDDPGDLVRIEIESALKRDIYVIPLFVQRAQLPPVESLPESLRELAYRQGMSIGNDPRFAGDINRLITILETILPPPAEILPTLPQISLIGQARAPRVQRQTGDLTPEDLSGVTPFHPLPPAQDDGRHEPEADDLQPTPGPEPHEEDKPGRDAPVPSGEARPDKTTAKPAEEVEPAAVKPTEVVKPAEVVPEVVKPDETETAAVWAIYPLAFLLGAALPITSALWGLLGARYVVQGFVRSLQNESELYPPMLFTAEMFAAYSVAAVGFLVGFFIARKRLHTGRGMTWLISAVLLLLNLGGFLYFLFIEKVHVNHVFFLNTTFLMTPLMPLLAYLGLHLGMRFSSRKRVRKSDPARPQEVSA